MALRLADACYEAWNQVMRQMMFTTVFIERKYHKSKTKSYLKTLQLITNSSHSYINKTSDTFTVS